MTTAHCSLTGHIASRATALSFSAIPDTVITHAETLIIDTTAVGWAGRMANGVAATIDLVAGQGGTPEAGVLGKATALPMAQAAFLNSLFATALDYDSLNGSVHADAVAWPAALAAGQGRRAAGQAILRAYVLGAELIARLQRAETCPQRGWSATSIYGGFGAALSAGLLLELDTAGITRALGLALGQVAGTKQANVEHSLLKRLQPAFAARNGVFAAQLAHAGLGGPSEALEGRFGLGSLYHSLDGEKLLDGFGTDWAFLDTGLKPYPVCACSYTAMEALLRLMTSHELDANAITRITVEITPFISHMVGNPPLAESDPQVTAQFSLAHALAVIALRRDFRLIDLDETVLTDPAVRTMTDKIKIDIATDHDGEYGPAIVTVQTKNGSTVRERVSTRFGTKQRPLPTSILHAKWTDCLSDLGADTVRDLREQVAALKRKDTCPGIHWPLI